jgi:hypothetical protein
MKPISTPFQIDYENKSLIGIDRGNFINFFKMCFQYCKAGKIYQFKVHEVTHSELQRNYLFLCMALMADETGRTTQSIRAYYEDLAFEVAMDNENDFLKKDDWIINIVNFDGEVTGVQLKSMTDWNVSMMNDFIDLVQGHFLRQYENFGFPNPKDYDLPKKGRKNELPYPELIMKISMA